MKPIAAILFLFALWIMFNSSIWAQTYDIKKMKNWELKGYAKNAEKIGDSYAAILFYKELIIRNQDNKLYMFKLGEAYKKNRDYLNAQNCFKKAFEQDNKNFDALFNYARMLKIRGEYSDAMIQFKNYESIVKKYDRKKFDKAKFLIETEGIKLATEAAQTGRELKIEHLDNSINKSDIEFSPLLVNDSLLVYGSSDADTMQQVSFSENRNEKFRKFFCLKKTKRNSWQKEQHLPAPFFNDPQAHTGSGCFSLDKNRFYFTKCKSGNNYKIHCNLFVSEQKNNTWQNPVMLSNEINSKEYTSSQPAIGSCYLDNLEVIYFISDRPGGMGGSDIWYTVYNTITREYTKPANAGIYINSPEDEKSPFYDMKTHALYFSSNGWPGFGGLDIFRSFGDLVNWSTPENAGSPINSSFDDLCYTSDSSNETGFFTSNRTGSFYYTHENCCDDLYSFTTLKNENIPLTAKLNSEDISNKFMEKNKKDSTEQVSYLKGKTASLYLTQNSADPIFIAKKFISGDGELTFNLIKNKTYRIVIEDDLLMKNSIELNTLDDTLDEIRLDKVNLQFIPDKPIVLQNILYDFDVYTLSETAKQYLDTTLIIFMNNYPDLDVEIYSHTDNKGGEVYNKNLSQKRAEYVIKYLVEKGIAANRLTAYGLGMSVPVAKNANDDGTDNPEGRKLNRRTEFKINKEKFGNSNTQTTQNN